MVGWITDATCVALTSQGMFAFSNKQTKNPDSVYAEGNFFQGKDPNLKTFLLHFVSVYSYLPFCVCEYALYKHEKKKGRDLQQRVDKTTIKKLPGSTSAISAIFTKPVERVMRMGFTNKQRFVEEK